MTDDDEARVAAVVDRFDRPGLQLLTTREELTAWAEMGLRGPDPLGCELSIRRHIPTRHEGLARGLARRAARGYGFIYLPNQLCVDDLFAAGRMGLLKAALRFDVDRGIRFATYATYHVRNEIALEVRAARVEPRGEVWLEGVGADRRTGRGGDDEGRGREVDPRMVALLLRAIPRERDRAIVMDRFGAGGATTLEAIGVAYGVSKERVRQVMAESTARMRDAAANLGIELDRCYLDAGDAHVA